jgi:hypothetical protein
MKKLSLISICAQVLMGILFYFVTTGVASADSCDSSYVAGLNGDGKCTFTPEQLTVSVYKFGVCQDKPTYLDSSSCVFFLNSQTAQTVSVTLGQEMGLPGDATFELGAYNYLVQLWDSSVSFKFTHQTLATAQYGADGIEGRFCYSNGNVKPDDPTKPRLRNVSCATSAESAISQVSTQNISPLSGAAPYNAFTGRSSLSGFFDAQLLSDPTTLANISFSGSGPAMTMSSDAEYLFTVLTLSDPLVITESTKDIKLQILLTDSFTQESYFGAGDEYCNGGSGNTGARYCLGNAELSSLGFTFTSSN